MSSLAAPTSVVSRLLLILTASAALGMAFAQAPSQAAAPVQPAAVIPKPIPPPNPLAQIPAQPIPSDIADGFTLAAVGDLIMARPEMAVDDPGFQAVARIIQGADVSFGNMENTLIDRRYFKGWPAAENGGGTENGPPSLALDLKKMGFEIFGHANNHDTDWGILGMEATDRVMDEAGLVHAGSGKDRAAARAARYWETKWGRVALVAMTSTFEPMEPAGNPLGEASGRPGVSALHTTQYHYVTPQQMGWLRQIDDAQPRGSTFRPSNPKSNDLTLFGVHYRIGEQPGSAYEMNPYDLSEILKAIREGKEDSNFELVYIHDHEPGNGVQVPADFEIKLAHEAIDTGADEFAMSGPHQLRGIEIYKGKPIFYSLGNFFFEVDQLELTGPDMMEGVHLNPQTTTDYEYEQLHVHRGFNNKIWYQSVVAVSQFDHGRVSEIKLYPVDLGFTLRPEERGIPRMASPEVAQEILERLQRLSQPFGTTIAIENGVGIIRPE